MAVGSTTSRDRIAAAASTRLYRKRATEDAISTVHAVVLMLSSVREHSQRLSLRHHLWRCLRRLLRGVLHLGSARKRGRERIGECLAQLALADQCLGGVHTTVNLAFNHHVLKQGWCLNELIVSGLLHLRLNGVHLLWSVHRLLSVHRHLHLRLRVVLLLRGVHGLLGVHHLLRLYCLRLAT